MAKSAGYCSTQTSQNYSSCQKAYQRQTLTRLTDTIITCFPKRWGRNKPDPSAVHKGLRLRLKVARKDEIRSVYDLALIIIDQCSRVFFDRTKTADRQPRVMDLFANAIGDVVSGTQYNAYGLMLTLSRQTSRQLHMNISGTIPRRHLKYTSRATPPRQAAWLEPS